MALRAVVLSHVNAHPTGTNSATLSSKVVFLEDGYVVEDNLDWDVDFTLLSGSVASLTNVIINYALNTLGKTVTAGNILMPTYRLGSLI